MTWEEIGFFGFQGFYLAPGQVVFSAAVLAGAVVEPAWPTDFRHLPSRFRGGAFRWVARPEPLAMSVSATNAVGAVQAVCNSLARPAAL